MVGGRRGDVGGGSHHPGNFSNKSRRDRRRKNAAPPPSEKCDASTSQSNYFGVSRKRFTPSTTGSIAEAPARGGTCPHEKGKNWYVCYALSKQVTTQTCGNH